MKVKDTLLKNIELLLHLFPYVFISRIFTQIPDLRLPKYWVNT